MERRIVFMRDSVCISEKSIQKRDHRALVNLCSTLFVSPTLLYLSVFLFLVNHVSLTGVSICGRLEDRITIQQNEVSEDGAPRSMDHLGEVHVGEHHCIGLITFWKVVSTNLFYLDYILIECMANH